MRRTFALCAVLCGADSWVDVELFGRAKEAWLRTFLSLPNGIPSHDTFGRVFARLDARASALVLDAAEQRELRDWDEPSDLLRDRE